MSNFMEPPVGPRASAKPEGGYVEVDGPLVIRDELMVVKNLNPLGGHLDADFTPLALGCDLGPGLGEHAATAIHKIDHLVNGIQMHGYSLKIGRALKAPGSPRGRVAIKGVADPDHHGNAVAVDALFAWQKHSFRQILEF